MPLQELQIEFGSESLPENITAFLAEADRRCDEYFASDVRTTTPRFIPADYALVYRGILELKNNHPLLGERFCEWGSGLGTATCLASFLGFEACGIEIEAELVKLARRLAKDFDLPASFLSTSFLPEGFDFYDSQGGRELAAPNRALRAHACYPENDWELEEIDLFYVYPWPEEQAATLELFDAVASDGAYLLCYFGEDDLCTYIKTVD